MKNPDAKSELERIYDKLLRAALRHDNEDDPLHKSLKRLHCDMADPKESGEVKKSLESLYKELLNEAVKGRCIGYSLHEAIMRLFDDFDSTFCKAFIQRLSDNAVKGGSSFQDLLQAVGNEHP